MPHERSISIGLPIEDRLSAMTFYRAALGWEPVGEPVDDGVPEPLQYDLGGGVRLVLVPSGGFSWVLGGRPLAAEGTSECVLSVSEVDEAGVDAAVDRAVAAGATLITAPGQQPWGYSAAFADPDGHVWMVEVGE